MTRRSNGDGNITTYRLADGSKRWSICYRVPDPTGGMKQKREGGFTTITAARKRLREALADVNRDEYVAPDNTTFGEQVDRWLQRCEDRVLTGNLKPSTVHSYRRNLTRLVVPTLGAVPIQALTADHLEALYSDLLRTGVGDQPPLSGTSVRYVHTIIGAVLKDAKRRKVAGLTRNVATDAEPPAKTQRTRMVVWTTEQASRFIDATCDDQFGALWLLLLATGARRGEALAQTWDSLDLDAGIMRIDRSMVDTDWGVPVFETPKTDAGYRDVHLDDDLVAVLRRHRTRQAQHRLQFGASYPQHNLVFVYPDGTVPHVDYVSVLFKQTQRKHGMDPVIRLHDLRHTSASWLLERGVAPTTVQERLGHANPAITMTIYAHALPGKGREAANVMGSLLRRGA